MGAFKWCFSLTIYCEAKSKPTNWHTNWNPDNRPVVWGHGSSEQPTAPKGPLELVSDDGLEFTVTGGTAKVSEYTGTDTEVIIPAAITYNGKTYKVTAIGDEAFRGCYGIDEITIPNSVTSIGESSFSGCSSLTSITIPDSVTSIGAWAFGFCENLTFVSIPKGVTSIGDYAFARCENLTSVTIPNSVTSIGRGAFYSCTNLTSITIPDSVTTIGVGAFAYCKNLTIYCEAESKPEGWDTNWNYDSRPVVWGYKGE